MTTAREKLYEEMIVIVATPAGAGAENEMRKLMSRYRVQTKPGVDVPQGATARDALGDRLLDLWRTQPDDIKAKIGTAIDEFRMQQKSSGSSGPQPAKGPRPFSGPPLPGRPGPGQPAVPALSDDDEVRAPRSASANSNSSRSSLATTVGGVAALGVGDPPSANMRARAAANARPGRATTEPVAGGPRRRGRTRGECPKCHSMGVVLARSYSGDEYFSCIYCGWQASKHTEDDDPNASLAVRLLGQSPTESSRD